MSPHFPIPETERVLLPRALIKRSARQYRASWRFRHGDLVSWFGEEWMIIGRECTAMGRQLYDVYRAGDERPVRLAEGRLLSLIDGILAA